MGDPIDPVELAASVMIPSTDIGSGKFAANLDIASIKSGGSELMKSPAGQVVGVFLAIAVVLTLVRPGFVKKRRRPGQGENEDTPTSYSSIALYAILFTLPLGLYMVAPGFVSSSIKYVREAVKSASDKTSTATDT